MNLVKPIEIPTLESLGRIHFIGMGGYGMSGIAQLYLDLGFKVSGSDRENSVILKSLAEHGAKVYVGQRAENIVDVDTVVYSSAIRPSNPERVEATRQGLTQIHRSVALAALTQGKELVSIIGTHGKTTTSAMVATMLHSAGCDTGYVIGSALVGTGSRAGLGKSNVFVVEADESDGSAAQYPTKISVITNIEVDHLDNWGTPKNYRHGFYEFANGKQMKTVIINSDDTGAVELASTLKSEQKVKVITYGQAGGSDFQLSDIQLGKSVCSTKVQWMDGQAELNLQVPGLHNLVNATAAFIVGLELGLPSEKLVAGLAKFQGTLRRFQKIGDVNGVQVYDDYSHMPTEIKAALNTARLINPNGRVIICFQPFLYSRTMDYTDGFGEALAGADLAVVTDILAAREDPVPGVSGKIVADSIKKHGGNVIYVEQKTDLPKELASICREEDLILTMGPGDVSLVAPILVKMLQANQNK